MSGFLDFMNFLDLVIIEQKFTDLKSLKRTALLINIIGCIFGLSTLVFQFFNEILIYLSFVYPIFCIILVRYYRGLISIEPEIRPNLPTISIGFMLSCFGLIIRTAMDYNVLDYKNVWVPSSVIALLILIIYYFNQFKILIYNKKNFVYNVFIIILIEVFSIYSVIFINCKYDQSTPQIYETQILKKIKKNSKGGSSYYLIIEDWNNTFIEKEIKVDYKKYYSSFEGEKLKVAERRGRFDIPWSYFIE
ncbi:MULTISPECIES: hypothetical protein [Empedobacter]|uniref:hypothetical protein n=4 Tax=Weeksellaceae TaxID=2762318 RepID=UPI001C8CFA2C|nr:MULTISPECIES: hypothetical protein [Empedobacter]MBY0066636.1 hypothetical protein [Empedobacter falsenii]